MKKIMRKFCEKNYAKISRKNGNYAINENFAKNAELLKNKCTKLQKFIKKEQNTRLIIKKGFICEPN